MFLLNFLSRSSLRILAQSIIAILVFCLALPAFAVDKEELAELEVTVILPAFFGAVHSGDRAQRLQVICRCQEGADIPERHFSIVSGFPLGTAHCGEVEIRAAPNTHYRLIVESQMPQVEGRLVVYGGDDCSPLADSTTRNGAILLAPADGVMRVEIGGEFLTGALTAGDYDGIYRITAEYL